MNFQSEMWQHKPLAIVLAFSALCAWVPPPCTAATGKPLVTAISKDAATALYTVPMKDGHPLVLDLSGPLIWTTCAAAAAAAEHTTLSANATDGKNPLGEVSFSAVTSCAPDSLAAGLPAGAVGVAGLGRSKLALPEQIGRSQRVAGEFALCLPSGGPGVAIFGGRPVYLTPPTLPAVTATLAGDTPLHRVKDSPGYFIAADKGIAVNQAQVRQGPLLVGLSSRAPYTELRPDVYHPLVAAFDRATAATARVTPAVAPFELCYDSTKLGATRSRLGYPVPRIDLMLEGGKNWTVLGGNSMVDVNDRTACLAFVEMKEVDEAAPAVVLGGFQMENNLLVFDDDKGRLGFSGLLWGRLATCGNFDFTPAA